MDFLRSTQVKTRKQHQCIGCFKRFKVKSILLYNVFADQGKIDAYYICKPCNKALRDAVPDDEFTPGELREWRLDSVKRYLDARERRKSNA